MVERLYRMLWSRVGGKPWTYIIRDEFANPLYWFAIGLVVGYVWEPDLGWILGLIVGILLGHFWWGGKATTLRAQRKGSPQSGRKHPAD